MMRLVESVMQTPEDSLILWKKYAFIKQCLTRACENEYFDADAECFAAFICVLGLQQISIHQLCTADPTKKITDELNLFYNVIASQCKNAVADDLISISIGLLPTIDNYELLLAKLNVLYQIRQLQFGYDSIAGCYVTFISAITLKIQKSLDVEIQEDDVQVNKIIAKMKTMEASEQKSAFTKLFSDTATDKFIKNCVNAYEQVFENKDKFNADMNIFSFYSKQLEWLMFELCKKDDAIVKKYFANNDISAGFKQILQDYKDEQSLIFKYITSHEPLKLSFENYNQSIKLIRAPSESILTRLWRNRPF